MGTSLQWPVWMRRNPDDVSDCWRLPSDKARRRIAGTARSWWGRCRVAQKKTMTHEEKKKKKEVYIGCFCSVFWKYWHISTLNLRAKGEWLVNTTVFRPNYAPFRLFCGNFLTFEVILTLLARFRLCCRCPHGLWPLPPPSSEPVPLWQTPRCGCPLCMVPKRISK